MALGGSANAAEETIVSVNLLSEMLNVSGLGPYSRTELINLLAGKQVSFSFSLSNFHRGFQGSSTTQDIHTLFEMIHLFFTNPRLDERAIAAMLDQYRTALAHQEENPTRFFSRELSRMINNNHPLFMPLELADMDRVSVEQASQFLSQCINPGDYTFIFTGNIDLEIMRELSAVYIASIPNAASMNQWHDPVITRPQEGRRTIFRGVDERCIVYIAWFAPASSDFNEQRNQVAAVLSEYINIIVNDEVRERLGGVYSISAGASVSVIPTGESMINVYFICDPARAEELITAVYNVIIDLVRQPLDLDTFNNAKEALLMGHERAIERNLHIAQSFGNSSVLYDTPLNRLYLRPDAINAVTLEDVQALCAQILSVGSIELVMFPESWSE
jgi:zinc protease